MLRVSPLLRGAKILARETTTQPHARGIHNSLRPSQVMAHVDTHSERYSLQDLPKSNVFTQNLPADAAFPTPQASHNAPRQTLGPRMVKEALFTYVRPDAQGEPELLAVSPRALQDLGLKEEEAPTDEFKAFVAGQRVVTWDESKPDEGIYPWAQCYGGYQFGQWAGQLGDGRAISLFESTNPATGTRYEVQLKGAGRTPYSRFADGRAVLRSSIREFVVSEYLNAIGIPSTRALALTLNHGSHIRRERVEPGAIVTRFAQSWIRFGTFDLQHIRGDRTTLRTLADYTAEHVYGGWDQLPSKLPAGSPEDTPRSGIPKTTTEGDSPSPLNEENRYTRLYRAILRRNATTVAAWQAYGFMNGVLNTDNTSILGLSIDFGPFAFLDTFDPTYTPNHDDHMLRYAYRNQPSIIWWNLTRLGETLGELIGAGALVDDPVFVEKGVTQDQAPAVVARAEAVLARCADEFKSVFLAEYTRLMTLRLGLTSQREYDFEHLFSELLDTLQAAELDFHHAFRRLSGVRLAELDTEDARIDVAARFFSADRVPAREDEGRMRMARWLGTWAERVCADADAEEADEDRMSRMKAVNPNFIPRSWILDEVINRVEKKGERDVLPRVMRLALSPFEEAWDDAEPQQAEAARYCGDVPRYKGLMQCSCSS